MSETLNKIPTHVSIIMDGNGRWAKERGKERTEGHKKGVDAVRTITQASVEFGIKYLSVFAFSEENWGRPESEVSTLMSLMLKSVKSEFDLFMRNGVRFRVLGNTSRLSPIVREAISKLEKATENNDRMTMIVFISYSGKWDILQAAQKMAADRNVDPSTLTIEDFDKYLVTAGIPDPDVIIRTSGEKRLSNYLLWQGAYSEFVFVDTLWPDFGKQEYFDALKEYESRDRRYGKVK